MDPPPDYEAATGPLLGRERDLESGRASESNSGTPFEEFDVDDSPYTRGQSEAPRARGPVELFKLNMVVPVRHFVVDPVYKLWVRISALISHLVGKVMNPLLAKRLVVLVFITSSLMFVYWKFDFRGPTTDWSNPQVLQSKFTEILSRESMQHTAEYWQGMTHNTGTMGSTATAEFLRDSWVSYGFDDVELNEYPAFLTFANKSSLQLLDPDGQVVVTTELDEDVALESPTHSQAQPKPHMGLGVPGDAQGHLVYANYGTTDDLRELQQGGVSIKGAIVLVKHGKLTAALKSALLQSSGAVAVLFFSEKHPTLAAWPEGPDYSEGAVQRANLGVAEVLPGDVLSPGWNSRMGMRLEDYHECRNLVSIPVAALSWRQAEPYLQAIRGHGEKKDEWHNHGYPRGVDEWWTGDSESPKAHLVLEPTVTNLHNVDNVIGMIRGSEQEDKAVILGARYDDVCFGGVGLSGMTVLTQVAKVLARLRYETNWRPRRSIYFAAWTGTADNFIGSSEWIETVRDQLINTGLLYIDLDGGAWGPNLDVKAHPSIDITRILEAIEDPAADGENSVEKRSLWAAWQAARGPDLVPELPVSLGNYMAFLSHASTPTVSLGFKGEVYPADSCFDTLDWQRKFGDSDLRYHEALAKIAGFLAIEFSDQPIIPYNLENFGKALKRYLDDVKDYAHERFSSLGNDIDFGAAHKAADTLVDAGSRANRVLAEWLALMQRFDNNVAQEPPPVTSYRHLHNNRLVVTHYKGFDRVGLTKREWFKNILFGPQLAPPLDRSLGGTFPGLRDAIASGNFDDVQREIQRVADAITGTASIFADLQ